MSNKETLLRIRKQLKKKKPEFNSQDTHKKPRIKKGWRRPRGIQSKMRLHKKGYNKMVSKGYKSPKLVRGLNREGHEEIMVKNVNDLKNIKDIKTQAVKISGTVGQKKKIDIVKEALKSNMIICNLKNPQDYLKSVEDKLKKKAEEKAKKTKVKEKKSKEKEKEAKKKDKSIDSIAETELSEEKKAEEKKKMDKFLAQNQ